jgi:hypothetical protein
LAKAPKRLCIHTPATGATPGKKVASGSTPFEFLPAATSQKKKQKSCALSAQLLQNDKFNAIAYLGMM